MKVLYNPQAFFTHAALLDPRMAGLPLRTATDRHLGRPLPYQLANRTQVHPKADACKQWHPFTQRSYAVLAQVSSGCPPL